MPTHEQQQGENGEQSVSLLSGTHSYLRNIFSKVKSSNASPICCPPPVSIVLLSMIQEIIFVYDLDENGHNSINGTISSVLIYDPLKRYEAWRFLTYMFVHTSAKHLIFNLLAQIVLAIYLEMEHKWWRVPIVYVSGVIAASLGTSITYPKMFFAGASGGGYALLTAHIASVIMFSKNEQDDHNFVQEWNEKKMCKLGRLLVISMYTIFNVTMYVRGRYFLNVKDDKGPVMHLYGAIAGLSVGMIVLRDPKVKDGGCRKKVAWVAFVAFFILVCIAIVWNIAWTAYFPTKL